MNRMTCPKCNQAMILSTIAIMCKSGKETTRRAIVCETCHTWWIEMVIEGYGPCGETVITEPEIVQEADDDQPT